MVVFDSGLGFSVALGGGFVFICGVQTLAFLLEDEDLHLGSDLAKIVSLAQRSGLKVQIVPKSQRQGFLHNWASQRYAAAAAVTKSQMVRSG